MLVPALLTLAGLLAAFVPVVAGVADLPDWVAPLLLLAGASMGVLAWRRGKGRLRAVVAGVQVLLLAAISFWLFSWSSYDAPPRPPPVVGDAAPPIEGERVRDGARFRLAAQRGGDILLVFFRGAW